MIKINTEKLNLFYGDFHALIDVNLKIHKNKITSFIGPSGCGKSTLLRCFNRMNDLIDDVKIYGKVEVNKQNIYKKVDLIQLRRKVGMVFQRPNPFPLSIYENCIYGPKVHSLYQKKNHDDIVFKSLEAVNLWDEVKDKLFSNAMLLSAEQKQRLCIARLLAINAEILLMDEPCSTLDPIATQKIEELLMKLKRTVTVVIVTHNMQQASRISDQTGFFLLGEMIEFDDTLTIFTNPKNNKTQDYIEGKFG